MTYLEDLDKESDTYRDGLIMLLVDSYGEDEDEVRDLSTSDLEDMVRDHEEEENDEDAMYPNGRDYDSEDFDD